MKLKFLLFAGLTAGTSLNFLHAQDVDLCSNLLSFYTFNDTPYDQNNDNPFQGITYNSSGAVGKSIALYNEAKSVYIDSLPKIAEARTISFYVAYTSSSDLSVYPGIFSYGVNQANQKFGAYFSPNGSINFQGYVAGNDHTVTNSQTSSGSWYHITLTYDGTSLKCYINGTLRDTWSQTLNTDNYNGGWFTLGNSSLYAVFDDLKIYKRALSDAEVSYAYTHPESIPCSTLGINSHEETLVFSIYPNPANTSITLSNLPVNAAVQVVNQTGQVVFFTASTTETIAIETSEITPGIYFVRVTGEKGETSTQKLVVE